MTPEKTPADPIAKDYVMKTVSFRLTDELARQFAAECERRDVAQSAVIRGLVAKWIGFEK